LKIGVRSWSMIRL